MRLLDVQMLYFLWLLPVLVAILIYAARRRKQAMAEFAEPSLMRQLADSVKPSARRWKAVLVVAAFALAVFALARPAWNPVEQQVERRGRDVVFLVDVSRSMLAEDLAPNRLERAKLAMLDAVDRLEGDRVALVAFAGTAVVKCPPTYDYGFFRMAVEDLSVNSITRGGTLIGDAIRTTIDQVFTDPSRGYRDLILITDGEDHESFPDEAAKQLGEMGVRLIAIGLGDENQGRRIPVTGPDGRQRYLTYNGQEVWSRLDADTLRKMVNETPGGRYLNVATGTIDFGDVYLKLIAGAEDTDLGTARLRSYEEKYQIFLTLAFLLLVVEIVMRERKRVVQAMILVALTGWGAHPAAAQSARSLVIDGNRAYSEQRFPDAQKDYEEAGKVAPEAPQVWFNKGDALYQQGNFNGAIDAYEQAAVNAGDSKMEALSRYNQGNASFQAGREQAKQNPQAGIRRLEQAVNLYHDALDADPSLASARHNIEVAKRVISQLQQMPPPQQKPDQKDQQDKQDQKNQSQQQQGNQQQQQGNQQQNDQGQQQQDQQQQANQQQQTQNGQQQDQQQQDQQQQAGQGNQAKPQPGDRQVDPNDIIDKERSDRMQRQLRARAAAQPVDKDW